MEQIKLLTAVKEPNPTKSFLQDVLDCIQERLDWLDDREPESDGMVHEEWEEKRDDMEAIFDELDELIYDADEDDEISLEAWENVVDMIEDYQLVHGGLSRLIVYKM